MKKWMGYAVFFAVLTGFSMISLSIYNPSNHNIEVRINKDRGRSFISENQIKKYVEELRAQHPEVLMMGSFKPALLEEAIKNLDYIKDAQVSKDMSGNVFIDIEQDAPLGRIVSSRGSFYITDQARLLPLSKFYTPRVVVVSGRGADSLAKASFWFEEEGAKVFSFLKFLDSDAFWKAQVTQIELSEHFEIKLYTLVGNHIIELGRMEDLSLKLDKISRFYSDIVKAKGWQTYRKVKVQFDGQIVCE
jgi:cell division protein FtsQ